MSLLRRLTLLEASALNMANMVGSGPFITIPLILGAMGGPQAMLGWGAGLVLAMCDGLVWSELSTAMPESGGTYLYLRRGFGKYGRLAAFVFIFQFLVSGPAEIASGAIGFRQYLGFLYQPFHDNTTFLSHITAPLVCLICAALLYRRIESVGKLAIIMWIGMLATITVIIVSGLRHFNAALLTPPPGAFAMNSAFFHGLGAAMLVAMYDYLGYYDVCYVAEEVREPRRTIPLSILWSIVVVAAIYFLMNVCMIAVVPWREAMKSEFLASEFMERVAGHGPAVAVTWMVLWTAAASVFALILGGSRILFAAARDGIFFRVFARLHPTLNFPHLALIVIGVGSAIASLFTLEQVIDALIVIRILVQFTGQIIALFLLRRSGAEMPFKMAFYPLPAILALAGWSYIFVTSKWQYIAVAVGVTAVGIVVGMFSLRPGPTTLEES